MKTEQQQLTDYIWILEHNRSVDEDVRDSGHSERRHITLSTTTAELFAMMVTARALVEISQSLERIASTQER